MYGLLWIGFVFITFVWALHLVLGPSQSSYSGPPNTHRLTRSRDHWLIAGVCGGIAEFLGWQPGAVRALWLLGSFLLVGIGGLVAYALLAFIMPSPPSRGGKFRLDDYRVQ
jgi:phage shock protein C